MEVKNTINITKFSFWLLAFGILCLPVTSIGQVRYYFKNTSAVNQRSYADNEIYLNFQLDGSATTLNASLNKVPVTSMPNTLLGPDGNLYRNINIKLSDLPVNPATGQYYVDVPAAFGARLYVGFGGPVYRGNGNPILDDPGGPNYNTKIETIEFTVGGSVFTNTSRVDRYAYPMGEMLYCGGQLNSKVGETLTHEQVIAKWKIFASAPFQNCYDPVRDIITQMGHTEYFQAGNPGNDHFESFFDDLWAYASNNTMTVFFDGANHSITVDGTGVLTIRNLSNLVSFGFTRADMKLEDFSGGGGAFIGHRIRMAFGVSINRGAIVLTTASQNWENPNNFWQESIRNEYAHFFHSDFVSYNSKTYALAFDDVFNQSSTQACGNADSVVVYLGGFGTEHLQILDSIYTLALDKRVDANKTLQLSVVCLDQGMVDMPLPTGSTITWNLVDNLGNNVSNLINSSGLFGPTSVTGNYVLTATLTTSGGAIFTTIDTIKVLPPGTVGQTCYGNVNARMDYRLEVIGTRVYLTIITLAGWNNTPGYTRIFYQKPGVTSGAHNFIPNVPYPLDGFFFGDNIYFSVGTQYNGGSAGNINIPSLGTCVGLPIEEAIISLSTTQNVTINVTDTYSIPVQGTSNKGNTVTNPHPLFKQAVVFSGQGVDANGLFTPPGAGTYVVSISYDGLLITTTITVASNPLPLTLLDFKGRLEGNHVVLDWQTLDEKNTDRFDVERSCDGINFESINIINAAGNSSSLVNYTTLDSKPCAGKSYYRLKQIDKDKRFVYSKIIMVDDLHPSSMSIVLFPNPASTLTMLSINSLEHQQVQLRLYDLLGKEIVFFSNALLAGENRIEIDLSAFQSGNYQLEVKDTLANRKVYFKLVKIN